MREKRGIFSKKRGSLPEKRGIFSEKRGSLPEKRGIFSEKRGSLSEKRGKTPKSGAFPLKSVVKLQKALLSPEKRTVNKKEAA
jgi:hypothetical protein